MRSLTSICLIRGTSPGRNRASCARAIFPALLLLLTLRTATAAQTNWKAPSLGDWFISTNWTNSLVPNPTTDGIIANGGTALINAPSAQAQSLFIGVPTTAGSTGTLLLHRTGSTIGSLNVGGTIVIGRVLSGSLVGNGTLDLAGGARLTQAPGNVFIGAGPQGSSGSVTVRDPSTYLNVSGSSVSIGQDTSRGTLNVQNGGIVESGAATIAAHNTSTGSATVTGTNSSWLSNAPFHVGFAGTGSLTISNGGRLQTVDSTTLGSMSGGNGTATVTGTNSSWLSNAPFHVGFAGTGSLTISNGGTLQNLDSTLGAMSGGNGTATVTGNGSTWVNEGPLYIGGRDNGAGASVNGGSGSLRIQSGGYVQATHLKYFNNGVLEVDNGSTTVAGLYIVGGVPQPPPGGTLGDMVVGTTAAGRMEIGGPRPPNCCRVDGTVSNHRGFIGMNPGGNGAVLVTGQNSYWGNTGSVWVGNSGTGTLEIHDGGAVGSQGHGYIGFSAGSVGEVTVSGQDCAWLMAGNLYIGGNGAAPGGSGTLRFAENGYVQAAAATVYHTGVVELGPIGATPFFVTPLTFLGGRIRTTGDITFANDFMLGTGGVLVETFGFNSIFSGVISGSGGLTKTFYLGQPGGTLTLTGNNTYTGPTTINGIGTLLVNGSITSATTVTSAGTLGGSGTVGAVTVNDGGTVAPGNSVGSLAINGTYNQTSGGKLAIELGGYTPGTGHDQLAVSGHAIVGGTLNVSLVNGFRPNVGDTFAIITSSSEAGNFSTINSAGFTVRSDASAGGIVLTVTGIDPLLRVIDIARSGNAIVITFDATGGNTYRLERKLALTDATWLSIPNAADRMATENGPAPLTDPAPPATQAFYRVRLLP